MADHTLPTCPEPAWQKMSQSPLDGSTHMVREIKMQMVTMATFSRDIHNENMRAI